MNINVRFFKYDICEETNEIDIFEVNEREFLETEGNIQYERNTIFENGVNQICLTKTNNLVDEI